MEGLAVRHTHMSTNYEEIAQDALSKEQCCKKCCLLTKTSTFSEAILLVKECRESLHNLSAAEKIDTLRRIVKSCIAGIIHTPQYTLYIINI